MPPPPASPAAASPHHHGALASAVRTVSGLTLVSRFAGLARDVITARIFGDALLGSAFRAAYALPNLFRRLFGEGALSAAFLPEYTLLRRDDPRLADQLASVVLWILTLVTGGLTLIIEAALLARLLLWPAGADLSLSLKLIILMLPMMPAVCITAILGGMLQAHGRFGPPAAAPIILNLFQILAGVGFYFGWTSDATLTAYLVGSAAVLASAVQILWSLAALKGKVRWTRAASDARTHSRKVLSRFVPAMLGLGTLQLNTMMDTLIAMWPIWIGPTMLGFAVALDDKSNAILSYTQTLYQFPLGVFGIAVATAVFPLLSRSADKPDEFIGHLRRGLRLSLFIGLPASVGLFLVRHDLIAVIYSGGKTGFTADGLTRSATVLAAYAPAVWAYSLNHVFTRAFYARHDTKTPMRIAISMVALNLTLNLVLIWPLREAGLAASTATTATVQLIILNVLCIRTLNTRPLDRETLLACARIAGAGALMAAAVAAVLYCWKTPATWSGHALRLAISVITGAAIYAAAARLWHLPEMKWLLHRAPRNGEAASGMSFE